MSWQWHAGCSRSAQPMKNIKNIDLNQLESTTGGYAPYCYPPPACAPPCMLPAPAAQWRWAAHEARAAYRAAAAYYGWAPAARWWR